MKNLLVFILIFGSVAAQAEITVTTTEGPVVGYEAGKTVSFKGIPYAAPPVGDLRFAPAEPALIRSAALDARDFGPNCLQVAMTSVGKTVIGNEDCLRLNIWKPKQAGTSLLPVMVFLHGGANINGAGNADPFRSGQNLYDGEFLSAHGHVLIVTLNYRLGSLGFMAHPALSASSGYGASGNYGIFDQIQALKWVQQNIKNFGGDPAQVTLFGESAGAIDSLTLLASPLAKGLFSGVIIQSGFLVETPLIAAEISGRAVAERLGCSDPKSDIVACLRSQEASAVILAGTPVKDGKIIASNPVIDGKVLQGPILNMIFRRTYNSVPVVIGTNADEMTTLAPILTDLPNTEQEYENLLVKNFGAVLGARVLKQYPPRSKGTPRFTFETLLGDLFAHCPARKVVSALSTVKNPVWRYVFTHVSENPLFSIYGAGHALELPYVFHFTPFFMSTKEEMLSQAMASRWTEFATQKSFSPAQWREGSGGAYMEFDVESKVGSNYKQNECDFWQSNGM